MASAVRARSSEPHLNPHILFPDHGSPFGQEMLDDSQQASPCYPGSYSTGALSPGSSDVSITGEGLRLRCSLPSPKCP